jgi:inorganic pyrophosphatase
MKHFSKNGRGRELVDVVVETPRGCRNKFKFDEHARAYRLGSVLPSGLSFPYDFGFFPKTKAQDGDPLDVLILMDESAFPGCIVTTRLIGVIEAEQTEKKEIVRNDRLIAVAENAHDYSDLRTISDLNKTLLKELERFFISYNETKGKEFRMLGVRGPKRAWKLLEAAQRKRTKK